MLQAMFGVKCILCLLSVCLCHGIPMGKSSHYTVEEDRFIIGEVFKYPGEIKPIHGKKLWEEIADNHSLMCKLHPSIFRVERSPDALKLHFRKMLISKGRVSVPETLLQKLPKAHLREQNRLRHDQSNFVPKECNPRYTEEEDVFIINEVEKYPCEPKPIHGKRMWRQIAEKHSIMRQSNPSTFPGKRTAVALRMHFRKILASKGKLLVPSTLMRNLAILNQRGKDDVAGDETNFVSEKNARYIQYRTSNERYNCEEDKFIIETVLSYPQRPVPIYGNVMWSEVADQFQRKRELSPTRFPYERSGKALRARFISIMKSKGNGQIRNDMITEIRRVAPTQCKGAVKIMKRELFTKEEDQFIFDELLQPYCTSLYSRSMWKNMKVKHDEKRISKTPGFQHERTGFGLRSHFIRSTLRTGTVTAPRALRQKFSREFSTQQDATPSASEVEVRHNDLQDREEEEEDAEMWVDNDSTRV